MTKIETDILNDIMRRGPNRVVVNNQGDSFTPQRAVERGVVYDVVFVRDDGWSLGAPQKLAAVAELMWTEVWQHVVLTDNWKVMTYANYRKQNNER